MEQYQIDRIKKLMEAKGFNNRSLAHASGVNEMTIGRILNKPEYNPSIPMVDSISNALGVDTSYIIEKGEVDIIPKFAINGYIEYGGNITAIKTFKQLESVYESVKRLLNTPKQAKALIAQDKANQKTQSKEAIDISKIDLFKREQYDTKELFTWSFRKSEDEREGIENDLGNMCQGYPFKVCGEKFLNSECAYISGLFSQNTPKATEIQRELQKSDNGYGAKKEIRRKYEQVGLARDDWKSFNVAWMLFVVWQKVTQNKKFAEKLRKIPSYAMIVENSTFQKIQKGEDTAAFWGMRNQAIKEATEILESAAEVQNYSASKKDVERAKMEARNSVNHIGIWAGCNCMGKILSICKHCLEKGIEPPIDYDLLRSKQIYLFGKLLTFDEASKKQKRSIAEPTETSLPQGEELTSQIVSKASEGDIYLEPDIEVNGYKLYCCYTPLEAQAVKKTRWCYCNAEGKYRFYTQNTGFLFVAAKKGYADIKNPHQGNDVKLRFKLYDDFATSLFSLTTFVNPKTKKADIYSVTFRRNDTSHQYEGIHMNTYGEMMKKASELLGGFDIAKYCIEKTEERLGKDKFTDIDSNEKSQDAIQRLPMPRKTRVKVTVAKEKKTSKKDRIQTVSQNDGQTVETNFELTEQNKVSKKEMLSIKSGELLDDIIKQ